MSNPTDDEANYRRRLGRAIVSLREAHGMSQAVLAETIERSEAAVSRWETGKATPSAYDLRRIALAVELPEHVSDLLVFPPEVYDPVMERLFSRIEQFANRDGSTRPRLLETAEQMAAEAAASGVQEGLRRHTERRTASGPSSTEQSPEPPSRGKRARPIARGGR